jgi:hypothetical protein
LSRIEPTTDSTVSATCTVQSDGFTGLAELAPAGLADAELAPAGLAMDEHYRSVQSR